MYRSTNTSYRPLLIGSLVLAVCIWLIVKISPILTPFIAAAILAYILNPMVEKLSDRGIRRPLASMLVMVMTLTLLVVFLMIIIPMLINQFQNLMGKMPQLVEFVQARIVPWLNSHLNQHISLNAAAINKFISSNSEGIKAALSNWMPTLAHQSSNVFTFMANMVLLPILLYYILLDWTRWRFGFRAMIPRRYINDVSRIMTELDRVLGEFLRGQIMVMLIMGLLYGTGLALTGLENGFAIGMLAGLLVFIPYLGMFTGLLLATIAAVLSFNSWVGLVMVWGVFAIGQIAESYFVTPKLVGERIGLSPLGVIFALLAFGQLMGFVGMLLALPMAAICLVLFREALRTYFASDIYLHEEEHAPPISQNPPDYSV